MAAALVQGASRGIGRAMVKELAASGRFSRVFAACRRPDEVADWADSAPQHVTVVPLRIDLDDDGSIEAASKEVEASGTPLSVLINAAGLLHDESRGIAPERKLEDLQLASLQRVFQVNTFGPMLMARHFSPLLVASKQPAVFASISARVGSIGDCAMGGWYSYRASKAAQNMFTKALSIELLRRSRGQCAAIGLHPGTVPAGKLFEPDFAAARLLRVVHDAMAAPKDR